MLERVCYGFDFALLKQAKLRSVTDNVSWYLLEPTTGSSVVDFLRFLSPRKNMWVKVFTNFQGILPIYPR